MLASLSVRNVVLIEEVDFSFRGGFCVLTGETGAGKSVLLDSLALATGRRADPSLLRAGAAEGSVAAVFEVPDAHPAARFAAAAGIDASGGLVLRRALARGGASRAFVNDRPVTVRFLDDLGDLLVQIHGQHDRRGLLDPSRHGRFLDGFGSLADQAREVAGLHRAWQERDREHRDAAGRRIRGRIREEERRALLAELDGLAPQQGEETSLAARRELLMRAGDVAAALGEVGAALGGSPDGPPPPRGRVAAAGAALAGLPEAEGPLGELRGALGRVLVELDEADGALDRARAELDFDPSEAERVEERLFALRGLARRHATTPDGLAGLQESLRAEVGSFDQGEERIDALAEGSRRARAAFEEATRRLGAARERAGAFLDGRIADELGALRLQGARFVTTLERVPPENWGASGGERVRFRVSTLSDAPPGPLDRIASGGELSRFLLAVHVSLARVTDPATLVFDEIDAGVGGAVADAVGQRLSRLSRRHQVLAVTHQPQVAARGGHQWRVTREGDRVEVAALDGAGRVEEIARMLSAADVTGEARDAARRLLEGVGG